MPDRFFYCCAATQRHSLSITTGFMKHLLFFLLIALVSCTEPGTESKGVIYDSLEPLRDSLEAARNDKDTLRVVPINNFNKECQTVEDTMAFRWPIHVAKNDLGYVRVRSDASCFEVDSCFHNLLGTIKDDQWMYAYGPVKYKFGSAGLAYVICVKDSKGRFVEGYISETVVDID
jgi:hypothetical protein